MKIHRIKILFIFLFFPAVASSVMQAKISLWDAITNNDEAGVNKALESGIDINASIKKEEVIVMSSTPLLLSIEHASPKIVESIAKKADINNQGQPGYTALTLAISQNDLEKAEILLRHGADVDLQDQCGLSLLSYSIRGNKSSMLELLFAHNVDVNKRVWDNSSALSEAITYGNPKMVQFLVENNAHLNTQVDSDFDALVYAKLRSKKSGDYSKMLKLLNQSPVLEEKDLIKFHKNLRS